MEKSKASSLIGGRLVIFSLLKNTILMKLIEVAKEVKELDYEHVGYLSEEILKEISSNDVEKTIGEIFDLDNNTVNEPEKLTELFNFINSDFIREKLKSYNKTQYYIDKLKVGHEVIYNANTK